MSSRKKKQGIASRGLCPPVILKSCPFHHHHRRHLPIRLRQLPLHVMVILDDERRLQIPFLLAVVTHAAPTGSLQHSLALVVQSRYTKSIVPNRHRGYWFLLPKPEYTLATLQTDINLNSPVRQQVLSGTTPPHHHSQSSPQSPLDPSSIFPHSKKCTPRE